MIFSPVKVARSTLVCLCCFWLGALPTAALSCGTDASVQKRFILNGGEAYDTQTKLTWQRCSLGLKWQKGKCVGDKSQLPLAQAELQARAYGPGWHVPSGAELQSLVDRGCGTPTIDTHVFPDVAADAEGAASYWTTSPVGMANLIYYLDFMTGEADGHTRGFGLSVRLVK